MKLISQHNQLKFNSANKGISLLEMIVVMTIIAVLAGITYPIVVNYTSSSQQVKCLNNLKKIHVSLLAYDHEHGCLPDLSERYSGVVDKGVFDTSHHADCLRKQLEASGNIDKNSDIWICKGNQCGCNLATGSHYQVNNSAQTYPSFLFGESNSRTPSSKSLSDISNPKNTWIVSDIHVSNATPPLKPEVTSSIPNSPSLDHQNLVPYTYTEPNYTGTKPFSEKILPTHNQRTSSSNQANSNSTTATKNPPHRIGYNYLFADGRVKHVKLNSISK